ncbi:Kelch repeat-containing protein [Devosia nitrariae]|nr:kelch repeat-containing protein [Devosia nitrariae]
MTAPGRRALEATMPILANLRMFLFAGMLALIAPNLAFAQLAEASGVWMNAAALPEARTEVSLASDGTRLYLAGGFSQTGGTSAGASRALFAYEPDADAWTKLSELPEGVNHAPLVHLDGRLYVVGGYRETTSEPIDALRIYDIERNSWSEGPPLPTARGALAVAVHEGRIHAIGGVDHNGNTGAHEIFDPQTQSWTHAAALPTPRNHHAAASAGGEIIVLAGRNRETSTLTANEIYDPKGDRWRSGADVPTGRSGVAAAVLGGQVYLFGGEALDPRSTFDEAERYDPSSDSWATLPAMPTARHGLGVAVLRGHIHTVAGGPQAGLTFSDTHEVLAPED